MMKCYGHLERMSKSEMIRRIYKKRTDAIGGRRQHL